MKDDTLHCEKDTKAVILRLKKEKRKGNVDEVLKMLIAEHEILKNQPKGDVSKEQEDDSIKCVNRILFRGLNWCVNKPPKMVKLETLDICRVCRKRRVFVSEPKSQSQVLNQPIPVTENKHPFYHGTGLKKATVYCEFEGMEVYVGRCKTCNQWDCEVKKKMRQKCQ